MRDLSEASAFQDSFRHSTEIDRHITSKRETLICSARKSTLLWYELLIYQAWKPSVWQNPDQVRTNQYARIYLNTALLYNKLIYLFTGNQAI